MLAVCAREREFWVVYVKGVQIIAPMSVNNNIFIGDSFELRIQVLQLITDVVSVISCGAPAKAGILRQFP